MRLFTGRTAHRGSRGIDLLIHDRSTRMGWGVSVTPRPLFTTGKDPEPIVQEAGWAPEPVWTGAENLVPHRDSIPDCPARSQSLYRLRYPAHSDSQNGLQKRNLATHCAYWSFCWTVHFYRFSRCDFMTVCTHDFDIPFLCDNPLNVSIHTLLIVIECLIMFMLNEHAVFDVALSLTRNHSCWKLFSCRMIGFCLFQSISNKMQRYTVYLYLETALHVSGGTVTATCRYSGR